MTPYLEIGCCGAVCVTCPPYKNKSCRGCKIGYENKKRDLARAKCPIKVCCMGKNYTTCGDCAEFESCKIVQSMYAKNGTKYKKYKKSMEFMRRHGYESFMKNVRTWKYAFGKLDDKS